MFELRKIVLGEHQVNCYLVLNRESESAVLVDPGDRAEAILSWLGAVRVTRILLTHGHRDHVGALEQVRKALTIPVGIHASDADRYGLETELLLAHGDQISLGSDYLQVVHLPGHTPGSIGFQLVEEEGFRQVIVGDAIFPGGPGRTETPEELRTSLETLAGTVFTWPDATVLHPGHGEPTTVGAERAGFEAFYASPRPEDLFGDVTWDSGS